MNTYKFAAFISYLTVRSANGSFDSIECETVSRLVNELNEPRPANVAAVDDLLTALKNDKFIAAIKAYRFLTGMGLNESKDAIEKYREKFK